VSADGTSAAHDDRERPLQVLGDLARREIGGDVPTPEHDLGRARALAAFAKRSSRARRAAPWLVALVAAAIACAIAALWIARREAPLRYAVHGAAASLGYVHAKPQESGAVVQFGDGSEIALAPGSAARIAEVGAHGARVQIESGTAKIHVMHLPGARWTIEAGPFAIAVLGTRFDVAWSPATQALDVRLHEGAIQVRGPLAPGGIDLRAGQHLVARGSEGEMHIDDGAPRAAEAPAPPSPTTSASATATAIARAANTDDETTPRPVDAPPRPAPRAPRWPARVAAGDFDGVLADASARGIDRAIRAVSLADLVALADAARYARRPDVARKALVAERDRFPRTAEARAAAFLLGRLADDAGGAPADAIRWYDAYLAEAPGGAFAAEALGRKMMAERRAKDPAAQRTATEYLRLHPAGPHAAAAREIASP
jgi:hypothetical protein